LSKCPLYINQGQAGEIWSVVHFPFTFANIGNFSKSLPSHFGNGSSFCNLSLSFLIVTCTLSGSSAGGT
jgi:hypothetical protein